VAAPRRLPLAAAATNTGARARRQWCAAGLRHVPEPVLPREP